MAAWRFSNALTGSAAALALWACADDETPAPPPPTPNTAPSFTSAAAANADENDGGVVYTATASDADGDALTFSIAGGPDAAQFTINAAGALQFAAAPDFENPADADTNNVYEVTLSVSDGTDSATLALMITVLDDGAIVAVRRVATGLDQPLFLLGRGDNTNRVFILEKTGQVEVLDLDTGLLNATPFLDISSTISTDGERGLLGMALAPDFAASGLFYVYATNLAGDTEVRRYTVSAADPELADFASGDVILTFAQPASNHNAGWIGFGPDGFLYIASGDGGGSNDPFANGQNPATLLGAMLRIDPASDDFPADPDRDYAIPAGNPAIPGGAPEVFAYGLRNPYRCSFDRETGDLYIGDVGQGAIEEISLIPAGVGGLNFGWPMLEGTRVNMTGATTGFTPPIAEYPHGSGDREGNSVTGGYVYRGPVDALRGAYIFADFAINNVWSFPQSAATQGTTIPAAQFTVQNAAFTPDLGALFNVASFGEDDAANLYIVSIGGDVFRIEAQ